MEGRQVREGMKRAGKNGDGGGNRVDWELEGMYRGRG